MILGGRSRYLATLRSGELIFVECHHKLFRDIVWLNLLNIGEVNCVLSEPFQRLTFLVDNFFLGDFS
jgi:hypothetical protein